MKRIGYFLVLLLLSAPFDDAWAVAPASPAAPLTDDNDDYLPVQRRPEEELSPHRLGPVFTTLKPRAASPAFEPAGAGIGRSLPAQLSSPFLHLLMILQI